MSANIQTMKDRDMQKISSRQKVVKIAVQVMLYAFLITMAFIIIFPFYWMIISSLKTLILGLLLISSVTN